MQSPCVLPAFSGLGVVTSAWFEEEAMQEDSAPSATRWIRVTDAASLPEGALKAVYPLGLNIVVARVDGAVYAVSGACPHLGCPLYTGSLAEGVLMCPCHDWRFDVRTGAFLDAPELRLAVYPVRTADGSVLIGFD
jgi:3-phenylpropionate/trans-cinnamate dioxygenase ferredoxin subunit